MFGGKWHTSKFVTANVGDKVRVTYNSPEESTKVVILKDEEEK
jgi:hypothetical protein